MTPPANVDPQVIETVEASLDRLGNGTPFFDRFYEIFLASSPLVAEKFAKTNFYKQKRALQGSLFGMLRYMRDQNPETDVYLREIAARHAPSGLNIGAELYDLWLVSLLAAVKECDPQANDEVMAAWDRAMREGVAFFLAARNR